MSSLNQLVSYLALILLFLLAVTLVVWISQRGYSKKPQKSDNREKTAPPEEKKPAPAAARSYGWVWWPMMIAVIAGLGWWGYKNLQSISLPRATAPRTLSLPLIFEATSYKESKSEGVEPNKEITPPEVLIREGGEIVFSFISGETLPQDKSVVVRAILVPIATSAQTHRGDPVFSIGESPNQKIHLRGGPQEIILGCPAREIKKGENYFSYKSRGMLFKISGPVRVYLAP